MQIKTINISYTYGKKTQNPFLALSDVTTTIEQGDSIGIIGETGSGKTTYIQHLNALLLPDNGQVIIGDRVIQKTKRKIKNIKQIRSKVGVVFQFAEYQLFSETVEKDIIFGPVNMGEKPYLAKKEAANYLRAVGMDPKKFLQKSPFELSGGQKRRVAIAGILAMHPDVLIFDEPTAGLDPQGRQEILDIFSELNRQGKTVVMVTHDLDNVLARTNKTFLFKKGKLVKAGDTYDILQDVNFLRENNLKPPQLLDFKDKLKNKGIDVGRVTTISELVKKLEDIKSIKKGEK